MQVVHDLGKDFGRFFVQIGNGNTGGENSIIGVLGGKVGGGLGGEVVEFNRCLLLDRSRRKLTMPACMPWTTFCVISAGSTKLGSSPYDSLFICVSVGLEGRLTLAVTLSNATGSLRPSRLKIHMTMLAVVRGRVMASMG